MRNGTDSESGGVVMRKIMLSTSLPNTIRTNTLRDGGEVTDATRNSVLSKRSNAAVERMKRQGEVKFNYSHLWKITNSYEEGTPTRRW